LLVRSLVGSAPGRDSGLGGDVIVAGVDQYQDGDEGRGDQSNADPERDVIAVPSCC
jgi:hypothetical protein